MIDALIHSPFALATGQGNSVTAQRTRLILLNAGFEVSVEGESYAGDDARCLIALNAWRSSGVIGEFDRLHPGRRIVVVVTGSDIHHPEMQDEASATRRAMARADALVMLHDADFHALPEDLKQKAVCIFPSVSLPKEVRHQPETGEHFVAVMAGNLRAAKNPQLAIEVAALLPDDSPIIIHSYGDASQELAASMMDASAEVPRFEWCGKVDHDLLLKKMAGAHLLFNTSTLEGGANAICEAVTMGLPVVASDIRGNAGMLGSDYPGLFPSGNAKAAVALLQRCVQDTSFYEDLRRRVGERAAVFDFATESAAWISLMQAQLAQ